MSRLEDRRPRRASLKLLVESLETRWLMSVGDRRPELDHPVPIDAGLLTRPTPHRSRAESLAVVEVHQAQRLEHGGFGPWGGLRLLVAMEAQGDRHFDALYSQLSARFARWSAHHPSQARSLGIKPLPLSTGGTDHNPGSSVASDSTLSTLRSGSGSGAVPDAGPPPPHNVQNDTINWFSLCPFCPTTGNNSSPPPNGPTFKGNPRTGTASSGSSSTTSSGSQPGYTLKGSPGPMESDAALITGEYLQDHQLATYQSLGQYIGIDLQYSALQADPLPVVTAALTPHSEADSANVTSITVALTVDGVSQGDPGTYDDVSISDTIPYLVQFQATDVSSLASGIYADTLTVTKHFDDGTSPVVQNYNNSFMLVNLSSSHYGSGWSIPGLQQIDSGTPGSTLMIADGTNAPEEFALTDGVHYTGAAIDTSTLTWNSSSNIYTRNYQDGSVVTFNSHGQEISSSDPNGNTTSFAYVTSGAADGALATITDPVGLVTTLTYNSSGELKTVTDPAGRVTTFTIDSSGDLTEIVDPDGGTTQYGYDSTHDLTTETDPNGSTATVTYDSFGRVSSEKLFDGTSTVGITPRRRWDCSLRTRYPITFRFRQTTPAV